MLADHPWRVKYTTEHGNLIELFYLPALRHARRYDRLTGYFSASALTLAARGIEALARNDGHMRLVVGCTLEAPEIDAIRRGEQLRNRVEQRLARFPLEPSDTTSRDALELLAWMVQHGFLDIRVAIPCGPDGKPTPSDGIFHEKSGIIEDRAGDKIAWTGSLNETAAGWLQNWESFSVFMSWKADMLRVDEEEANFSRIWEGRSPNVIVMDVPESVRRDLLRFMPTQDSPARLKPEAPSSARLKSRVWTFIQQAPKWPDGGERVGEATCPVHPWPHQVKALQRLYRNWPPRLLLADEVGLGKTIQAGLLLRRAWLAGSAKRILILAPKAILRQWQIELREKLNLSWPIYDGNQLVWYESPARRGINTDQVRRDEWHRQPVVIVSSQMMRRRERAAELLEKADPWDLVILDEAHHARRRGAGSDAEGGPNHLLTLMRGLREKTKGLVLLTATPMQMHPIEVWDLLNLLGLPPQWSETEFLSFFQTTASPGPSPDEFERMAGLFRAVESFYGETRVESAQKVTALSKTRTRNILEALRHSATIPRRQLQTDERRAAIRVMRANTPIRRLVSRHTRELLRRYFQEGRLSTPIAGRSVEDRFLQMSRREQALYDAVEDYISETYNRASQKEKNAVGFVMTIYRRRLASSLAALRRTLEKRRAALGASRVGHNVIHEDDVADGDLDEDFSDPDDTEKLESIVLAREERAEIGYLLARIEQLPPDTKLKALLEVLRSLFADGYRQVMVFTQYADTMDFLREELGADGEWRLMCFSGRGGEVAGSDGSWNRISRHEAKRRFRDAEADLLLCTDAAAEGLNFQFCGALINYDMPWNPMRVEQRIGRIDRLGQEHETIRIVNLHYEDTVESDIYRALRERIDLFQTVVGRLQPILAGIAQKISHSVLSGASRDPAQRKGLVATLGHDAQEREAGGFDFDEVTESDIETLARPDSPITMDDLDRVINTSEWMPHDVQVEPLGKRQYKLWLPDRIAPLRVTTDPSFYEEHTEDVELWSPGNPLFVAPEFDRVPEESLRGKTLQDILDRAPVYVVYTEPGITKR